jgi:hypothetical protein
LKLGEADVDAVEISRYVAQKEERQQSPGYLGVGLCFQLIALTQLAIEIKRSCVHISDI